MPQEAFRLMGIVGADVKSARSGLSSVDRDLKNTEQGFNRADRSASRFFSNLKKGNAAASDGDSFFDQIAEGLKLIPGIGVVATSVSKVAGAMSKGVKAGFDYNRALEEGSIAFEVLLKSQDAALRHLGGLQKFAEKSPFAFLELVEASKLMLAFGFDVKAIIPMLSAASDASAALGTDINGIITALGQMKNKGRVSMEEMNQLAERGIPAWKYVADAVAKTDKEFEKLSDEKRIAKLQKLSELGRLNATGAIQAVSIGMNKQFGGIGHRYATETASGLEANLADVAMRHAGTVAKPAFEKYKNILQALLTAANSEAASSAAQGAAAISGSVLDGLEKQLRGAESDLKSLGVFVGAGLGVGLDGAGVGHAKKYIDEWYKGTGTNSPSKEFITLGKYAAQGWAIGFEAELNATGVMGFFQTGAGAGGGRRGRPRSTFDPNARAEAERMVADPRLRALYEATRRAEGGDENLIVGKGGRVNDLSRHPNRVGYRHPDGRVSTAAGDVQITGSNWYGTSRDRSLKDMLGLQDFSRSSQMLAFAQMFREGGGSLDALQGGKWDKIFKALQPWAGTPGSTLTGRKPFSKDEFVGIYNRSLQMGGVVGGGVGARRGGPTPVVVVGSRGGASFSAQDIGAGRGALMNPAQGQAAAGAGAELRALFTEQEETEKKYAAAIAEKREALARFHSSKALGDAGRTSRKLSVDSLTQDVEVLEESLNKFLAEQAAKIADARARLEAAVLSGPDPNFRDTPAGFDEPRRNPALNLPTSMEVDPATWAGVGVSPEASIRAMEAAEFKFRMELEQATEQAAALNEELAQTEPIIMQNAETFKSHFANIGEVGEDILGQFFMDVEQGWKGATVNMVASFLQALQEMAAAAAAQQVWGMVVNFATSALGGLFGPKTGGLSGGSKNSNTLFGVPGAGGLTPGGPFGGGPKLHFAAGGMYPAGKLAVVGEKGPELFMAGHSGRIVPNHMLGAGGTSRVELHLHGVRDFNSFKQAEAQVGRRAAAEIDRARRRFN